MKQIVLLITMVASITSYAQTSFGVKAGANFAHQSINNSGLTQLPGTLTAFHGGVYMFTRFGKNIGMQSEVIYSRVGGTYDYPDLSGSIITDYYSIPVLFCYSISDRVTLHAGPQLGILNMAKQTINGQTEDIRSSVKTGDFGIAAGFSVNLPRGYQAGVRYVAGLRDINNGNIGNPDSSTTNGVAQVYVGLKLFDL